MSLKDKKVQELRSWAINRMEWERAFAKEQGRRLTPIKGGKTLTKRVQAALTMRVHPDGHEVTPHTRGKAAAIIITEAVMGSYRSVAS